MSRGIAICFRAQDEEDGEEDDLYDEEAMRKMRAEERRRVQADRAAERKRIREESTQREKQLKANEEAAARAAGERFWPSMPLPQTVVILVSCQPPQRWQLPSLHDAGATQPSMQTEQLPLSLSHWQLLRPCSWMHSPAFGRQKVQSLTADAPSLA